MSCRRSRAAFLRAVALCASLCATSCARQAPQPPILLITLGGLRADVVGGLGGEQGLTPNLDRLIATSTWAGRAISTSSAKAPAMASVLTGLRPWQHELTTAGGALPRRYVTLPQALRGQGYRSAGFTDWPDLRRANGLARGFDSFAADSGADAARAEVAARAGAREPFFVWTDLDLVGQGYRREERFLSRLPDATAGLPAAVSPAEIEVHFDPAVVMPPEVRARWWALYRSQVARADEQIGALLDALRNAGRFDDALIVVVCEHGEEFGEYGQAGHGGNLGRVLVEVPLVLKLPRPQGAAAAAHLAVPADERVSIARVFATLLAAAGGEPPPGVAPSLFLRDPRGALSELYVDDGVNTTSLVQGDTQLLRSVRFAPAQPDYFRARRAQLGDGSLVLSRPAEIILGRLAKTFRQRLPFTGRDAAPLLQLRRWLPDGGVEPLADAAVEQRMAAELERYFLSFVPQELTPAEALRRR